MPKGSPKKSRVGALKDQLQSALDEVARKETELATLKANVKLAQEHVAALELDSNSTHELDINVSSLLKTTKETSDAYNDYQNRVLALELQGLVERWRMMDVEELAGQNHDLRAEVMRLHQENMELSRRVAEHNDKARQDLARIELAMELTMTEKLRNVHNVLRQELFEQMDEKTKQMVADHGALQDQVLMVGQQAAALDQQYRALSTQRQQYKLDAEVAIQMNSMQARQAVQLRKQLDHVVLMNEVLQVKLEESEGRAERLQAQVVRLGRQLVVAQGGTTPEAAQDEDSAYGLTGEEIQIQALEKKLQQLELRHGRVKGQRDKWRERCILYEKTCGQLQAMLQMLQERAMLTLPNGLVQSIESIYSSIKDPGGHHGHSHCRSSAEPPAHAHFPAPRPRPATASGKLGASPRGRAPGAPSRPATAMSTLSASASSMRDHHHLHNSPRQHHLYSDDSGFVIQEEDGAGEGSDWDAPSPGRPPRPGTAHGSGLLQPGAASGLGTRPSSGLDVGLMRSSSPAGLPGGPADGGAEPSGGSSHQARSTSPGVSRLYSSEAEAPFTVQYGSGVPHLLRPFSAVVPSGSSSSIPGSTPRRAGMVRWVARSPSAGAGPGSSRAHGIGVRPLSAVEASDSERQVWRSHSRVASSGAGAATADGPTSVEPAAASTASTPATAGHARQNLESEQQHQQQVLRPASAGVPLLTNSSVSSLQLQPTQRPATAASLASRASCGSLNLSMVRSQGGVALGDPNAPYRRKKASSFNTSFTPAVMFYSSAAQLKTGSEGAGTSVRGTGTPRGGR